MPPDVVRAECGDSPEAQVSDGGICWQQARWYYLVVLLSYYLLSDETFKKCFHWSLVFR